MYPLDRDLRESLRRTQAPPHFAAAVIARARTSGTRRSSRFWLSAAAVLLAALGVTRVLQEHQRRAEGERAKQELISSLRMTGEKLNEVQGRLLKIQ
jgi:hypothetical protein